MLKKYRFTILFIGWVIFITSLSLFSFEDFEIDGSFDIPHLDKITHFIFYFVFAVLCYHAVRENRKEHLLSSSTAMKIVLAGVLYGALIELVQSSMPYHRTGELWDVLANSLGVLFGTLLTKKYFSLDRATK